MKTLVEPEAITSCSSQMENFRPFVYGLVDPADPGHVRYVGMASVRASRPLKHSKNAHGKRAGRIPHLSLWIRKLHSEGREYSVLVLETLAPGASRRLLGFVERCYIASLRKIGHDLINVAEGGDGGRLGKLSADGRAKLVASLLGNTHTLGYRHTKESNVKRSESSRRYFEAHPEAGARSGATRLGSKQTTETCAKKSAALKGNTNGLGAAHSEESKQARCEKLRGNTNALGAVHSEESKRRRVESVRLYNSDPVNRAALVARHAKQSVTMKALHEERKKTQKLPLTPLQKTQKSCEAVERKLAKLKALLSAEEKE